MGLSNIDIEPIDAVLIALDPLDREPTLLEPLTRVGFTINFQSIYQ